MLMVFKYKDKKNTMKLLTQILLLFIIAQVIGLFTANIILKDLTINPYVQEFVITQDTEDPLNALYFFGYVLFGAVLIMAIIHFYKGDLLFRILEFFMISTSSSIVFYAIARYFHGYEESMTIGIIAGLAFAAVKIIFPTLKNLAAVLATAGVGVIFGISLGIIPVILLLVLLSFYDVVAVFKTKHMVKMAEVLIKHDLAFTVSATLKKGEPRFSEKGDRNRIDLGTGDMVAPIMLEVSALSISPIAALFVGIGASVALILLMYFAMRKKIVLPALPPIVLGMVIAFVLGLVLKLY